MFKENLAFQIQTSCVATHFEKITHFEKNFQSALRVYINITFDVNF